MEQAVVIQPYAVTSFPNGDQVSYTQEQYCVQQKMILAGFIGLLAAKALLIVFGLLLVLILVDLLTGRQRNAT